MRTKSATASLLLLSLFLGASYATQVSQCEGKNYENLQENVKIGSCNKPPCKLKKKSTITVDIKFKPDHEIKTLTSTVYADVLGIPLPFIGVDGISACDKIFEADGTTPAPCPLKKDTDYVYKNSFPILEIYPRISPVVHWAITEKGKDISCFEVPARIY